MRQFFIIAMACAGVCFFVLFQNAASSSSVKGESLMPGNRFAGLCEMTRGNYNLLRKSSIEQPFMGFGCATYGGAAGVSCVVTSDQDNVSKPTEGMLRYCIEKRFAPENPETPVFISFSENLAGKTIRVLKTIHFRSYTTITGRMRPGLEPVTITNARQVFENPCLTDTKSVLCDVATGTLDENGKEDKALGNPSLIKNAQGEQPKFVWGTNKGGGHAEIFDVSQGHYDSDRNWIQDPVTQVIISDLKMVGDMPPKLPNAVGDLVGLSKVDNPCYKANSIVKYTGDNPNSLSNTSADTRLGVSARYVVGCPVMIDIGGNDPTSLQRTTNVVIANNDFSMCGNKCIVGNGGADLVTVTKNYFHDSYFSALILMSNHFKLTQDPAKVTSSVKLAPESRYTFYQNVFERVLRRNPRCAHFVKCHVFGNIVSDWGDPLLSGFGMSVENGASLIAEWNFFVKPQKYDLGSKTANNVIIPAKNPSIEVHDDFYGEDKDKLNPDRMKLFLGRWALISQQDAVKQEYAIKPMTGVLTQGRLVNSAISEKPFQTPYYYSTGNLSWETYNATKANAGPRN